MATYYVSATTGNDSNAGTSIGAAVATIGAGENLATTAGDIVYIAPGNYRESVTHGYSGTAANRIYFIGDPDCEIFTDIIPGVVRITHATDTDEMATTDTGTTNGPVVRTNGKDYITWKNVYVDGGSGGISAYNDNNQSYGFYATSELDYLECINCMAQSLQYGFRYVSSLIRCVSAWNQQYGTYGGHVIDGCLIIGNYYGTFRCDLVKNTILDAPWSAAYQNDKMVNCLIKGSYYGILGASNSDFAYDNVFIGNNYSVGAFNTSDTSQPIVSSSYQAAGRYITRYGKIHGMTFGNTYNQWGNNTDPIVGKNHSTDMQGDGLLYDQKSMTLWSINDIRKIGEGLKPSLFSKAMQGATTTLTDGDAGATDIEGNPRVMGMKRDIFMEGDSGLTTSSRDLGPWEFANVEVTGSYSSSAPSFKIDDEGMYKIPIVVSGSTSVTASIGVKHESGSGDGVKPQFILRYSETNVTASAVSTNTTTATNDYISGSDLYIQTVTSTANNNTWETISVSGSFDKNKELELVFYNQQTGSATSSFSDLEIT